MKDYDETSDSGFRAFKNWKSCISLIYPLIFKVSKDFVVSFESQ